MLLHVTSVIKSTLLIKLHSESAFAFSHFPTNIQGAPKIDPSSVSILFPKTSQNFDF